MITLEPFMQIAIEEAKTSLKEGHNGFGAVIVKNHQLIAKAHDSIDASNPAERHAETKAINIAKTETDGVFGDCILLSTHEPFPLSAVTIAHAGFRQIGFGYSLSDAEDQEGKDRHTSCKEIFSRLGNSILIVEGIEKEACALLYNHQVRKNILQLRGIDTNRLDQLSTELSRKRVEWFSRQNKAPVADDILEAAYQLFIEKLDICGDQAPVVDRKPDRLTIHSKNFCPTLEACKILDLDTRYICRRLNEKPTQDLLQQLHPQLRFRRNYDRLRPYAPYCEEMIILEQGAESLD